MKQIRNFLGAVAFYFYNGFVTHVPIYALRHAYLRMVLGISVGSGSAVHMGCFFTGRRVRIGSNTVINRNCYLDGRASLVIGDNVSVSPECYLVSLQHDVQSADFDQAPGPVNIEDYAWLGARVMVLPGVRLSRGTAVGAGAVVVHSTEPFDIVAGVPARKIGERNRDLRYQLRYFPLFNTDIG